MFRASTDRPWPGVAAVFVDELFVSKRPENSASYLNRLLVDGISPRLTADIALRNPFELAENSDLCFKGSELLGDFFLSEEERRQLESHGKQYREVCRPFIGGKTFTSSLAFCKDSFP